MDLIMDNIDFGVYVHKKVITEKRRERIKFKLPEDFKALAGNRRPPSRRPPPSSTWVPGAGLAIWETL